VLGFAMAWWIVWQMESAFAIMDYQ
jgi:hypothetical protein